MAFDPSVIASIGDNVPDIAGAKAKALTLADLYDENQLKGIQVREAKQDQSDMTYARQILAGKDLTKLEDQNEAVAKITQRSPKLGLELMKSFQGAQAGKVANEQSQLELFNAKNDILGSAIYPLKAKHDQLIAQGMNPQQVDQAMRPDMENTIRQMVAAKLPNGQPLLNEQDVGFIRQNFANGYNAQAIDMMVSRSTQAKAAIAQKMKEQDEARKDKDEDRKERATNAAISQGAARTKAAEDAKLDPETLSEMGDQYIAGDKSVLQNLGRGAQGASNIVSLRKVIREKLTAKGLTGADMAAKLGEFNGYLAEQRSLGTRMANIQTASAEAKQMLEVAKTASENVPRGTFRPWNQLVRGSDIITNDPAYAKLAAATLAVVNTWARAISPSGVPTVADKEHADSVLNTAQSAEAYQAVLDQFGVEIDASLNAPEDVKQRLHDRFVGKSSSAGGAGPAVSPPQGGGAGPPAGGPKTPPPPPGFVVQ